MKKHRMPDMKEGGVNVTPLIDVVMCLIIFYMVAARIGVSSGVDQSVKVPQIERGKTLDDKGNTATVNIPLQDEVGGPPSMPVVSLLDQHYNLAVSSKAAEFKNVLTQMKQKNAEFKIIIRGDKGVAYKYVQATQALCAEVGPKQFEFEAETPKQ